MKNFFRRLIEGDKKPEFVFTTNNIVNHTANGNRIMHYGAQVGALMTFDAMAYTQSVVLSDNSGSSNNKPREDERKAVQPKEVFDEIKKETPEISFENLPEKIAVVEERIKILREHLSQEHLGDEYRTIFYLKNRLKYLATRSKLPLDWAITTSEAIDDLCKRYKLRVVPLKQYYTLVPKDGIAEMDRYTKAYSAITGDKPIFELVIKDTRETEQKKKDRDPILLANSPLGNHLMILGAWDDEVEIVDEIIYGFK